MRTTGLTILFCLSLVLLAAVGTAQEQNEPTPTLQQQPLIYEAGDPIETLNFQAAEIRSVIRFLADYGKINVVVAPEVEGNVTISLKNVYWREALEIIGQTYNLAVVEEGAGYIRIVRAEDFRKEETEVQKHQAERRNLVGLDTRIIKINNSTAESVESAVQSLLSARGKATSDKQSNSIILQEVPENISKIEKFISELDQAPKQIRISAQLLEISTNGLHELGIDWSATGSSGAQVIDPETGLNVSEVEHKTSQFLDNVTSPSGTFRITTVQDNFKLSAQISALVSDGKGKIIAHPEITTIDNSEARIQMGQKVPIKQFDESGNTVITYEEVGTMLRVTPHITSNNRILMHLAPERSSFTFDASGVIINTNNAETNVVVENGQTAVIGGLTTQDETESEVGIPILKDIPILGKLFSYKTKRIENRDLVIFVTPTIVEDFAQTADPDFDTP